MKTMRSILLATVAAASIAVIPVACSSYSSGPDSTSSSAGTTGSTDSTSTTGGSGGSSDSSSSSGGGGGSCKVESTNTAVPPAPIPSDVPLPCAVIADDSGDAKCATAHSTVRVIVPGYDKALYQLCRGGSKAGPSSCTGETKDIMPVDGYADVAAHEEFCGTDACTITKIYDQSGNDNHLEPAPKGGAKGTPDNPAKAMALPIKINGHKAYGIIIKAGMGYRAGCGGCTVKQGKGLAMNDEPQSMYMITTGNKDLIDGCCFDYGNAETTSNDDGNGTMEAIYFGGGVVWGTGYGGKPGPWVMADLENGVYAGWDSEKKSDKNISTNIAMKFDFVTAVVIGDTNEKNCGKGRFALYGGDAQGKDSKYKDLACMYDGIRPEKAGYNPMQKQGSLILGTGGDNSSGGGGRFYEGATATGQLISKETIGKLQAAIVAAKYEVVVVE